MPFPLTVGTVEIPDPPALAALVQGECGAAPARVPGRRPSEWVVELVAAGALERRLAIGLAAALLQNADPATIAEGARLARRLGEPILGPILVRALSGHDTALLLQVDPAGGGASVEDTLLGATEAIADLADDEVRSALLAYLRNAGLAEMETRVLAAHGSAFELETWLPAVLAEPLSEASRAALEARRARGDTGGDVVARALAAPSSAKS